MVVLSIRDLRVSFPLRGEVLKGISLSLKEGEAILISGPSGSGKTTLLRVIASIIPDVIKGWVSGAIKPKPRELKAEHAVLYIPQEPWYTVVTPYVWSEIASFTDLKRNLITKYLKEYGLENFENRTTFTLSSGEIQRLNFIVSIGSNKKLLLLDEPTSHLDPGNAIKVINGVLKLKRLGKSLIIIDHYIERWRSVVDEILFLTNGTLTDINGVKDPYVKWRALIKSLRPPEDVGEVICDVSIKSFSYPGSDFEVLKDVVFEVRRGEIVWIKGPSGCGKTTLLRLIAKKFRSREGYVRVHGKTIYVPDNPLLYFSEPTPEAEVLGRLDILSKFGLKELSRTPIMKLSTGERRRLAIASILARKFDLALLDEPTIGLDPKSKYEVLKSIVSLAGEGVAVIISSHDEDLRFISSWVYELG